MYNNTGNKDVLVEKDSVTVRLVDLEDGSVVRTATAAGDFFLAANLKTKLGEIDLNAGTEETALEAGKTYEVRAYLNGEQLDEVLSVYVKSDDATAKKVTVKGIEATTTNNKAFTVQLPAGLVEEDDLAKLTAKDIVITPNHAEANVTTSPTTSDSGANWTAVITAEDGSSTESITIAVSIFEGAALNDGQTFEFDLKDDAVNNVAINFTANDAGKVKSVKVAGETLGVADAAVTASSVTISNEYLETLELEAGDEVKVVIEFEKGTPIEVTIAVVDTTGTP